MAGIADDMPGGRWRSWRRSRCRRLIAAAVGGLGRRARVFHPRARGGMGGCARSGAVTPFMLPALSAVLERIWNDLTHGELLLNTGVRSTAP